MKKIIIALLSITIYYACTDENTVNIVRPEVSFSDFLDVRDSSIYKCITIGDQTWMAENLNYRSFLGGYGGCYTYSEDNLDVLELEVNSKLFVDSVNLILARKEILDIEGVAAAKQPAQIVKSRLRYVTMGLYTPTKLIGMVAQFPQAVGVLTRARTNLMPLAIHDVYVKNLEKIESENGQYSKDYGLLYTYQAALEAVPEGWRLPTDEDWKVLEKTLGMNPAEAERMNEWRGEMEGALLKEGESGCGFNAKLGGAKLYGTSLASHYFDKKAYGYFWTSTSMNQNDSTRVAVTRELFVNSNQILRSTAILTAAYHVRCIKK
ncbi:MAG: fibrobacter succinogenes major paralogous domain-containing protein [Odoribacter sp.]